MFDTVLGGIPQTISCLGRKSEALLGATERGKIQFLGLCRAMAEVFRHWHWWQGDRWPFFSSKNGSHQRPGTEVHTSNPSYSGGEGRRISVQV
jgi:hypothetical protein